MVMEVLDMDLKIPAIHPPTEIMTMVFLMVEVFECMRLMKEVNLGPKRPDTLPLTILEFIVMVIKVVVTEEVNICIKRPATIPLSNRNQEGFPVFSFPSLSLDYWTQIRIHEWILIRCIILFESGEITQKGLRRAKLCQIRTRYFQSSKKDYFLRYYNLISLFKISA